MDHIDKQAAIDVFEDALTDKGGDMETTNTITKILTIKIDLGQSDANCDIKSRELIQQDCYTKLRSEIAHDLLMFKTPDAERAFPLGSGLVYFIDGTRGAGKSTFLQSAYEALSNEVSPEQINLGKLAYIDPSRIERSEIILLPILKELKRQVGIRERDTQSLSKEKPNQDFRDRFNKLAGGLSLFAPGNEQLKDLDPELFLDWGLERAGHGIELRNNLHALIRAACQLLDVKALVLAFDDADTDASNAHAVLECIRKYLDTPHLVVLVTGDLELYSQLVRNQFYGSLGEHLSRTDKERDAQRTKMVDHLEDQYLLKLFPIRRRVQLRPLWNLRDGPQSFELSCTDWNGNTRSLDSAIKELIRRGLRLKDSRDIALYYEFLLKQPLRSILQVLSRCAEHLSISDEEGKSECKSDEKLSAALSEGLRAMALGSLYKFGIDVDAIGAQEMPALIEAVFELTVRDGELDTGAYLRPQPSDAALKSCFAALSADVAGFCANKPSALLQYLFGGPGSVAIYGQVLHRKSKEVERDDAKELRAQFKKYVGIGRKEDALNWAWHVTAILTASHSANPTRPVVDFGVIGLNKSKKGAMTGVTATDAINECIQKYKSIPAFAFSLIDVSGQSGRTFASIFNILGLLDRLLDLKLNDSQPNMSVTQSLAKVFKTPTISRPGWEGGIAISADDNVLSQTATKRRTQESHMQQESEALEVVSQRVVEWLKSTEHLHYMLKPSAVLIGKIWTRLYFSLEKVSENRRRANAGAATLMEFFALCVINAFLVEELDHHLLGAAVNAENAPARKIDRSNPLTSRAVVADKFEDSLVAKERLPLTFLIASCPLILGLLKNDRKKNSLPLYGAMLNKLSEVGAAEEWLCDSTTWGRIESVLIAGPKDEQTLNKGTKQADLTATTEK
ncbi:MAG: hypothetical protein Q7U78_00840 [Gallionella sp.]|nr:hypothetical protein [Gallionella sp.]